MEALHWYLAEGCRVPGFGVEVVEGAEEEGSSKDSGVDLVYSWQVPRVEL